MDLGKGQGASQGESSREALEERALPARPASPGRDATAVKQLEAAPQCSEGQTECGLLPKRMILKAG